MVAALCHLAQQRRSHADAPAVRALNARPSRSSSAWCDLPRAAVGLTRGFRAVFARLCTVASRVPASPARPPGCKSPPTFSNPSTWPFATTWPVAHRFVRLTRGICAVPFQILAGMSLFATIQPTLESLGVDGEIDRSLERGGRAALRARCLRTRSPQPRLVPGRLRGLLGAGRGVAFTSRTKALPARRAEGLRSSAVQATRVSPLAAGWRPTSAGASSRNSTQLLTKVVDKGCRRFDGRFGRRFGGRLGRRFMTRPPRVAGIPRKRPRNGGRPMDATRVHSKPFRRRIGRFEFIDMARAADQQVRWICYQLYVGFLAGLLEQRDAFHA